MSSRYRWPAEWEHHVATWLSWPHNVENTWYKGLGEIHDVFGKIVHFVSQGEKVYINVLDREMEHLAIEVLSKYGYNKANVSFFHFPTNDAWVRDHGPLFVKNKDGESVLLNFQFNSWGGKYPYDLDNEIPNRIRTEFDYLSEAVDFVLEGGSIETNGNGILLTTSSCLLNPNRNPSFDALDITQRLKLYLGVEKIVWLGDGIAGDDTDGHVDDITRFVNKNTIFTAIENKSDHPNYDPLHRNLSILKNKLPQYDIVEVPMPDDIYYDGELLPASYLNFYISNKYVLVPIYGCEQDQQALTLFKRYFSEREVVGIDYKECILGLGSIHCLTMQQF